MNVIIAKFPRRSIKDRLVAFGHRYDMPLRLLAWTIGMAGFVARAFV